MTPNDTSALIEYGRECIQASRPLFISGDPKVALGLAFEIIARLKKLPFIITPGKEILHSTLYQWAEHTERHDDIIVIEKFDPSDVTVREFLSQLSPSVRLIIVSTSRPTDLISNGYSTRFRSRLNTIYVGDFDDTDSVQKLRVSADIPDWIDEEIAAEAVAGFIRALSKLHRAMGGGGLVVDGMEIESDILVSA